MVKRAENWFGNCDSQWFVFVDHSQWVIINHMAARQYLVPLAVRVQTTELSRRLSPSINRFPLLTTSYNHCTWYIIGWLPIPGPIYDCHATRWTSQQLEPFGLWLGWWTEPRPDVLLLLSTSVASGVDPSEENYGNHGEITPGLGHTDVPGS